MGVKSSNFRIGDLVVQRLADFNNRYFIICKVNAIEYVDELSDMWLEGYDVEPYYFYECEIVYLKQNENYHLEVGDIVCYEEDELISLSKFLNTHLTLQDYIDYEYNGKDIEF